MSEAGFNDHAVSRIEIIPVLGIGEVRPGDDLAALIAAHAEVRDGDVLVVTSKIVSKSEGRLITLDSADPHQREQARQSAIDDETVRVIAARGPTQIVQTRHGLVLASAGVDASNVARHELALLPVDPDASAKQLRDDLEHRLGVRVGVIVSDTFGRPWREGLTDSAIGVAGLTAVTDPRGQVDEYGNTIEMTRVAVADEIAGAADLVKGKLGGLPIAIVRGLATNGVLPDDGNASRELIRDPALDLFRLGTAEAIEVGRADAGGARESAPRLHSDAVHAISTMPVATPAEAALQHAFLGFLAARTDAMWRSCVAGHLTASTLLVDLSRRTVLLTLHPRAGRWVQLGGHCEPGDASLLDAAAREAREESGIGSLSFDETPLNLDVHPITCSLGVATRHFDVRFLAIAPHDAEPVRSNESLDLRWFGWDELPPGCSPELPQVIAAARARLGV